MNRFTIMAALALAACGAPSEDLFDDSPDGGDELGSVKQSLGAKETATLQFGTQAGGRRCNKTSSGQSCSFLRTKPNVKVCTDYTIGFPAPFTATEGNWASAAAGTVDAAAGSYTFDYSNNDLGFGCATTGGLGNHVILRKGPISGSSSSNYPGDFARPVFSDLHNLAEQAGVVGTYTSAGNCIVTVDMTKCQAKGGNAATDERYCRNSVAYAVAGCLGIGGQDVFSTGSRITRTTMNGSTFNDIFSTAELCQMTSLTLTADGNWQEHTPACNGD